jgi:hypothetical protein
VILIAEIRTINKQGLPHKKGKFLQIQVLSIFVNTTRMFSILKNQGQNQEIDVLAVLQTARDSRYSPFQSRGLNVTEQRECSKPRGPRHQYYY